MIIKSHIINCYPSFIYFQNTVLIIQINQKGFFISLLQTILNQRDNILRRMDYFRIHFMLCVSFQHPPSRCYPVDPFQGSRPAYCHLPEGVVFPEKKTQSLSQAGRIPYPPATAQTLPTSTLHASPICPAHGAFKKGFEFFLIMFIFAKNRHHADHHHTKYNRTLG